MFIVRVNFGLCQLLYLTYLQGSWLAKTLSLIFLKAPL